MLCSAGRSIIVGGARAGAMGGLSTVGTIIRSTTTATTTRPKTSAAGIAEERAAGPSTTPFSIAIDGNIGSGKSTLLGLLKTQLDHSGKTISFKPERTHEWKGMLPLYYEDTERWSFPFQMQVLLSHLKNHSEAMKENSDVLIVERSPLAARFVFGELLRQESLITEVESGLFDEFMKEVAWIPSAIVYLDCSPEVCLDRVKRRSREGEGIPLDYLRKVDAAYARFLSETSVPVIRIDSSGEIGDIFGAVQSEIDKLLS